MIKTNRDSLADIEFQLKWKSSQAVHTDVYYGQNINFWRDSFHPELYEKLMDKPWGDETELSFTPGDMTSAYDPSKTFRIRHSQFDLKFRTDALTEPCPGRFYPKGILRDIPNVFRGNIEPFRCVGVNSDIHVDFNHPLSERELHLKTVIKDIRRKPYDRGGSCRDWSETVTEGAGMQARWKETPTDFFNGNPFSRTDETPDNLFYTTPRLVNHIDSTASQLISGIYRKLLQPGMNILDLMSSWNSHLPDDYEFSDVTGLGLNSTELENNPRLTSHLIHDLNENPMLPFDDNMFDAAVCTVSVEYLISPFNVFEEIARILRPGGFFIVTFSNRWFPPKAIRIWQDIHELERMGLVTEYFMKSGRFKGLETCSYRGLPRPSDDKYASELIYSDPVYSVWGSKT